MGVIGGSNFFRRQIKEIREGGWPVVARKLPYLVLLLFQPVALLLAVAMRLVSPFLTVRLGMLSSQKIGPFASVPELYLCRRDSDPREKKYIDIFYYPELVCNHQLKTMWDRVLFVAKFSRFARMTDSFNRLLPGYERHTVPFSPDYRDREGLLAETAAHINFTAEEERRGREMLRGMGLGERDEFVCFLARDSAYTEVMNPAGSVRHNDYRNSSIGGYLPAAEALTDRGYFAVRMGYLVQGPMKTDNKKVIDYATRFRTDFMDIYLSGKCRFFISSGSGLDYVPQIFRRPVVYVNFIPLDHIFSWSPVFLFIPKKLRRRGEDRYLTFREIIDSGIGRYLDTKDYSREGIEFEENTPEEIRDVVIEADERLKGTWQTGPEDEELQRRFREVLKDNDLHGKISIRIGAEFLRMNRMLLE